MRDLLREHRLLAAAFFAYYLGFIAYGIVTGASQTIFYVVFIAGPAVIVALLYPRARFSAVVLWGLALWGLAHMVGGLVEVGGEVVYQRSLGGGEFRFDKVVHFFGFGFAALAAFELLRRTVAPAAAARSLAIAAAFIGLGIGAINETVEFLITLLPGDSNVGGFTNTGWDLVANTLGAIAAAVLAPLLERRREAARSGRRT